ncbi:hypothetical protein LC593_10840 [Nostoc sp. CHAB 5844]|nr:hypothetical protein [Nostoc sp. CHAB 5844]
MPWIEFEYFTQKEGAKTATVFMKNIEKYFADIERSNPEISIKWYRTLPKKPNRN